MTKMEIRNLERRVNRVGESSLRTPSQEEIIAGFVNSLPHDPLKGILEYINHPVKELEPAAK
jgi:hypothetical protein